MVYAYQVITVNFQIVKTKRRIFSKSELDKISKSLDLVFANATNEDHMSGQNWYKIANQTVDALSHYFKFDKIVVASVLSALSPRNKWKQNIKDTCTVLNAVNNNIEHDEVKVCTFNRNKIKAFNIAKEIACIDDSSMKTYSFVKNICELNSDFVTIDVWHLRACGKFIDMPKTPSKMEYKQIAELTKRKAKKYNLKGYEYQAIVWCSIRNS